ncbi:PucR family transcriptional regulator [Nocardia panacis]|uniref:PucR family transcriptional regulator n=1 Tax=Nocardia panacis TaxID=2340916 RepID=A0A3A4KHA2_9NOCA|nr:helix-turn-helix domain-containing protein [Nocardia panacis]RJO73648.1 PucR family transcriptional regulator [Nocardia panacis]
MAAPRTPLFTPGTRRLAEVCRGQVPVLTRRLLTAIFTDNPEWTDYSAVARADLRDGCRRYLTRILDVLTGAAVDPDRDDVAAAIGRLRAEQGVPMEAMLRTFRLGGGIVWEALLDNAETVGIGPQEIRETGTAMWTVIDGLSSALSTSYRNTQLEQVRRDERRRHALIEDLLAGRAHDPAFAAQAARELNLPAHGAYLVVATAAPLDGAPVLPGAETVLAALGIRSLWHSRVDNTIGVIALEHRDQSAVLLRLRELIRGRAACSPAVPVLAQVDSAHELALVALETVPEDAVELAALDERYPEALLVRSPDLTRLLTEYALGPVLALPAKDRDVLLETLAAWLTYNCSAANAALRLHCHRNTVLNRLQRMETLLGRSLDGQRVYLEMTLALTALGLTGSR